MNDAILNALNKLSLKNLTSEGNKIMFNVLDPNNENWTAVEAIVLVGGHFNSVNVVGSTLEDVYLKLVRESA